MKMAALVRILNKSVFHFSDLIQIIYTHLYGFNYFKEVYAFRKL